MLIETLLFYIFAGVMVVSALMVVSAKNPVHSVLFLILAFFNSAGLFVLLGAEFIAMLMVIVYVGAVAVLFLFVVMMMDINFAELRQGFLRYLPVGIIVAVTLFVELCLVFYGSAIPGAVTSVASAPMPPVEQVSNTEALGMLIYTRYVYPFQIAGIILLVAMIGAIVLTLRHRPGVRRQKNSIQVGRTRQDSVEVVEVQTGKGI